jgi:PEP-CTERM motif-containing protein
MKTLLTTAAVGALLLGVSPNANATLAVWANINGTIISCTDGAACDTNPAAGQLSVADQLVGGVQFIGSSQTQVNGPPQNSLNTASFQVINNNATAVAYEVLVSGTSFTAPIVSFAASGAGTFQGTNLGSTITLSSFIDTANAQGALGGATPGTNVFSFSHTDSVLNPDSFSNSSGLLPFSAGAPFSMTLEAIGTLTAGESLVGRTQAIVNQVAVPEPGTLGILGAALVGFGWLRRKRNVKGGMANV